MNYIDDESIPEMVTIKACGVWDTVGSLGVPRAWFLPAAVSKHYGFVDTIIAPNVEYGFHALALDERRRPFSPTIWERPHHGHNHDSSSTSVKVGTNIAIAEQTPHRPIKMKQVWFRGVHSDVGGGSYPNQMNANLTFAWMIAQLKADNLLEFDEGSYWDQIKLSARGQLIACKDPKAPVKDFEPRKDIWNGGVNKSMSLFYKLTTGSTTRGPRIYRERGKYWYQNNLWIWLYKLFGGIEPPLLQNTHETVHYSVRSRDDGGGVAMSPWVFDGRREDGGQKRGEWVSRANSSLRLEEDKVEEFERELERQWPAIVKKVKEEYEGKKSMT